MSTKSVKDILGMISSLLNDNSVCGNLESHATTILQFFALLPREAGFEDLHLPLGIAIFSKSTAHAHFLEDFVSELFNMVKQHLGLTRIFNI